MEQAEGKARELLDELVERGGDPGPMVRAMANAPTLLRGYLDLSRAMKRSHIDRRSHGRINLAVHEWLGCDYCLVSAHPKPLAISVSPGERVQLARQGTSGDPAIAAVVAFAQQVLAAPGEVGDEDFERLHGTRLPRRADRRGRRAPPLQLLTGAFNLIAGIHAPEGEIA